MFINDQVDLFSLDDGFILRGVDNYWLAILFAAYNHDCHDMLYSYIGS